MEEIEAVGVPLRERRLGVIQVDDAAAGRMQAAEVHHQVPLDVDPDVVVAGEGEALTLLVGEVA